MRPACPPARCAQQSLKTADLFIYLFIYLFVCLFVCLFIYLFVCLFIYLFIYLFVYLFIYLFVCLFVYLFVCLFVCLFICLFLCAKRSCCTCVWPACPPGVPQMFTEDCVHLGSLPVLFEEAGRQQSGAAVPVCGKHAPQQGRIQCQEDIRQQTMQQPWCCEPGSCCTCVLPACPPARCVHQFLKRPFHFRFCL